MKSLLPILVLYLFLAGFMPAHCPAGDLNGDCEVNLLELQIFTEKRLGPPESSADGDDKVNMNDFALLAEGSHNVGIPLVINEFMASNNSYTRDPQDQYDDWIEIYNYGTDAIDIAGIYLTDNLSVPTKWRIPSGNPATTTIPAGGYLLIWADNDTGDVGLHANFKLNAGGEQIALFDSDGRTLVDSVILVQY